MEAPSKRGEDETDVMRYVLRICESGSAARPGMAAGPDFASSSGDGAVGTGEGEAELRTALCSFACEVCICLCLPAAGNLRKGVREQADGVCFRETARCKPATSCDMPVDFMTAAMLERTRDDLLESVKEYE